MVLSRTPFSYNPAVPSILSIHGSVSLYLAVQSMLLRRTAVTFSCLFILINGWLFSLSSHAFAQTDLMSLPDTATQDVVDDYFGRQIADPYRWLEDTESDATAAWIEAQNKVTDAYLESIPQRREMLEKLQRIWNYERFSLPRSAGDRYVYSHNDGLQDQSILYKSDSLAASLSGDRQTLIDPNSLSEDGTIALAGTSISDDGKLIAYGIADGGSDWRTWKVRDIESGKNLDDVVQWVKFSGIAWKPDGSGFFYGRYDRPTDNELLTGTNENQKLYFHRIGDDQSSDTLVLERPDFPKWGFSPTVTDDGRYLVINNWQGSEPKSQVFIKDLRQDDSPVVPLVTGFDAEYDFVASNEDTIYLLTDSNADRRRLIAVPAAAEDRSAWQEVIAESEDVLQGVSLFGDTFYASFLKDARAKVTRHTLSGKFLDEMQLPGVGTVGGFGGKRDAKETFFSFSNYVTPTAIYRVDLATGASKLWKQPELALDVEQFVTEQFFCTSNDGTKVPVIVTRRKDSVLDGTHPTVLYGYGGFNISITPSFSPGIAAWVDSGGIYAVANLRGGGEYGRQWHEAGMRLKKQNVFDDCIAAAESLIAKKYTSSQHLALSGRSNGGLLVGAVMTQRPELFGACLPAVGVMDMLRYHKFTIGWAWAAEFGSSEEEDQIDNLLSYSPLHNLKPGTCYPATLVLTADRDDRVVPGHSFKFAAALQAAQADDCDNPTLIRVETRAGHGAGTPTSKKIEEYADCWAFLLDNLR